MSRDEEHEQGFLSRWSQRKREQDTQDLQSELSGKETEKAAESEHEIASQATTETGQDRPVWQRDDVDEDTKKAALRALFRKPEFNIRDGLNEYDDDFTKFASLGDIVTHEMKRMLKLAEEKTRPPQMPENSVSKETDKQSDNQDKEDKDLA